MSKGINSTIDTVPTMRWRLLLMFTHMNDHAHP
jgi:hypothetical protein